MRLSQRGGRTGRAVRRAGTRRRPRSQGLVAEPLRGTGTRRGYRGFRGTRGRTPATTGRRVRPGARRGRRPAGGGRAKTRRGGDGTPVVTARARPRSRDRHEPDVVRPGLGGGESE